MFRVYGRRVGGGAATGVALLGTGTDEAVARQLGRTWSAVSQKRAALKIPAHRAGDRATDPTPGRKRGGHHE